MRSTLIEQYKKLDRDFGEESSFQMPHYSWLRGLDTKVDTWLSRLGGEPVLIVGDYDADGVLSSVSAVRLLKFLKIQSTVYIPNRERDGYGFKPEVISERYGSFRNVLVLDSGTAHAGTMLDSKLNCLIIDHHEPLTLDVGKVYPNLINPHLDYDGPGNFCTASLLYLVGSYIVREHEHRKVVERNLLVFGGIATITDVCDMWWHNRPLVKSTLTLLNTKNYDSPLKYLLEWLNIPVVSAKTIGWKIGPMLNAPGRVTEPMVVVDFLLGKLTGELPDQCSTLQLINEYRKSLTTQSLEGLKDYPESNTVLVSLEYDRPIGINGLVAGGLTQRSNKPAFALSFAKDKGLWEGSGRAPVGCSVLAVASDVKCTLQHFGGHEQAMGLATRTPEEFKKQVENIYVKRKEVYNLVPLLVTVAEINLGFVRMVEAFGPFGNKLPEPTFEVSGHFVIDKEWDWGWTGSLSDSSGKKNVMASKKNWSKAKLESTASFLITVEEYKGQARIQLV